MPKESGRKVVATNRKARHDYHVLDTYEAGIALMGTEVKSLREGHASMVDGFCTFYNDELWMEGIHIPEYNQGSWTNHSARRRRKLLLHREELNKISREDPGVRLHSGAAAAVLPRRPGQGGDRCRTR